MSIDNPLSANYTKWSNTLKQFVGNLPTNCLVIFDHFVQLALKGLRNSSVFPTDYELYIDKSLSNVTLTDNDIGRIIRSLDPNKTHRHGRMSIHMLKICEDSIYKHLEIVFRACLAHGVFPQNCFFALTPLWVHFLSHVNVLQVDLFLHILSIVIKLYHKRCMLNSLNC